MRYVLSLTSEEEYEPYWFECDCSKEAFVKMAKNAIEKVIMDVWGQLMRYKKEEGKKYTEKWHKEIKLMENKIDEQ